MCDRHDIGVSIGNGRARTCRRRPSAARKPRRRPPGAVAGSAAGAPPCQAPVDYDEPRVFVYDNYPGGIGLSRAAVHDAPGAARRRRATSSPPARASRAARRASGRSARSGRWPRRWRSTSSRVPSVLSRRDAKNRSCGPRRSRRPHPGDPEEPADAGARRRGRRRRRAGAARLAPPGDERGRRRRRGGVRRPLRGGRSVGRRPRRAGRHRARRRARAVRRRRPPLPGVRQRHGHHLVERYLLGRASHRSARCRGSSTGTGRPPPDRRGRPAAARLFRPRDDRPQRRRRARYAFLVGFGYFDDDGFRTRQFFLRGYGEERALLHAVEDEIASGESAGRTVLVTYNGRAFDVPLIDTRYQMHRLRSPFGGSAARGHALPGAEAVEAPARRLTADGRRLTAVVTRDTAVGVSRQPSARRGSPGSCALTAIERDILGLHRQDDVPGWEIPARYFGYTRTGDARGLAAVLEHNRLDLVSLGAVAARDPRDGRRRVPTPRASVTTSLALGRLLRVARPARRGRTLFCGRGARRRDGGARDRTGWSGPTRCTGWRCTGAGPRRFDDAAVAWRELAGDTRVIDASIAARRSRRSPFTTSTA